MAFEVEITKCERDEVVGKDVLRVEGIKEANGEEWKTIVFINKYNAGIVESFESRGEGAHVMVTMEKRESKGKTYWNVSKVEDVGEDNAPPETEKPKAPPKSEQKPEPKSTSVTQGSGPTASPDNWLRIEALKAAVALAELLHKNGNLPKKLNGELMVVSVTGMSKNILKFLKGENEAGLDVSTSKDLKRESTVTPPTPVDQFDPGNILDDDIPF